MPSSCDGCGAQFSLGHALDCKIGRLITQRHNGVRDALGDIAALTYKQRGGEGTIGERGR